MTNGKFQRTTGLAIEVLTAQFDNTGSKAFASERVAEIAAEGVREGGDAGGVKAIGDLCAGLVNVAGLAITELSEATGVTPQEWLRELALRAQSL